MTPVHVVVAGNTNIVTVLSKNMYEKGHKPNEKGLLFRKINERLNKLDASIGRDIRCPLCWERYAPEEIESHLSFEHVPPTASAKLIGETRYKTITCKQCNSTHGSKYHSALKRFLIFQLHQSGKYDGPIRGTITTSNDELKPLKSNIVMTAHNLKVVGVPKANADYTTQEHVSTWDEIAINKAIGWSFKVNLNYGFRIEVAWSAYLQVAYLLSYILTECRYAFSKGGMELRRLIQENKMDELGPSIIVPQTIGVGGTPWIVEVTEPSNLRCLWVKIAGNIVIMPLPDDGTLSCYREWQDISRQNHFGLSPQKTNLSIVSRYVKNANDFEQCVRLSK